MRTFGLFFITAILILPVYPQQENTFVRIVPNAQYTEKFVIDYFPLAVHNMWEYFERDTISRTSAISEIIKDTIMANGLSYSKMINYRWSEVRKDTTAVNYYRKDADGNVYTYLNNQDKLLFDFHKLKNDVYPSPWPGCNWLVKDKYFVQYEGMTLAAVDFLLSDTLERRIVTIIEKFGIVKDKSYWNLYFEFPERIYWGCIINDTVHGELLAKNQVTDWFEYYPLNIGDYWKYSEIMGPIPSQTLRKVVSEVVMPDNKHYKKIIEKSTTPSPYESIYYERMDSLGNVWQFMNNKSVLKYSFSPCVGDTFAFQKNQDGYWEVSNKTFTYNSLVKRKSYDIQFMLRNLPIDNDYVFSKYIGLTSYGFEGGYGGLLGGKINGVCFGDTTALSVNDKKENITDYSLEQNYPNPFNPSTMIKYAIAKAGVVSLKLYDVLGKEKAILVNERKEPGSYNFEFKNPTLSSGIYFYTLKVNDYVQTKKMVILK